MEKKKKEKKKGDRKLKAQKAEKAQKYCATVKDQLKHAYFIS